MLFMYMWHSLLLPNTSDCKVVRAKSGVSVNVSKLGIMPMQRKGAEM